MLKKRKIFSKEASFIISDILSDRDARSTTFGLENPLAARFWTAVKTGTSKDMRDNWCIGYSRRVTVGVWVGNFSGEPMWNVSGVTGAAPIWIEVMNFLHRNGGNRGMEPPASLVKRKIHISHGMEPERKEWFIRGTEPNGRDQKAGQLNQRIVYPPSGAVIALDPDIPQELQKVFFVSQTNEDNLQWKLNDQALEKRGRTIPWGPRTGKFTLALADNEEKILDFVYFEVRGPRGDGQHEMNADDFFDDGQIPRANLGIGIVNTMHHQPNKLQ